MNEIKKCSLAGISFTLENDAHAALAEYIQSLQNAYRNDPDGEEIIADIEARIAELILSAIPADAIVTKPLILNIIKQLGSAEEIESEQPDQEPRQAETTDAKGNPRIPRRLYRDVQHHKLGGVCAGIANYFDIDPAWVRLAMFIPLFLTAFSAVEFLRWLAPLSGNMFGVEILGYIVMWFTIPPASTARQKLEMRGERITTDSIRENVQNATSEEQSRTLLADIVNIFGKILLICLKILAAILLVGLVVGVCVLGMVALAGIPMLGFNLPTGISLITFFFVAMIPLLTLIYLMVMLLLSLRPKGKVLLVAFILWIIALVGMTISAIKSPARFDNSIENLFESVFEHDEEKLYKEFTQEEIDEWRKELESKGGNTVISSDSLFALQEGWDDVFKLLEEKEGAINDVIEEANRTGEEQVISAGNGVGATKHVDVNNGNQTTSCNVNGNHIVIFTGDKDDVERCRKELKFEPSRLSFSTKNGNYSIEYDGRAYKEGKRLENVTTADIADYTRTYCFEVDGVTVKYFNLADIERLTAPVLDEVFSATGYTISAVEQILGLFNNVFVLGDSNDIEEAKKDILKAREEIEREREKIQKELKNLNQN